MSSSKRLPNTHRFHGIIEQLNYAATSALSFGDSKSYNELMRKIWWWYERIYLDYLPESNA